ncbi:MAG: aspartate aminotransferase family protein [Bacteroidia bacterium]|nr:aspartate aminotransferase family protein [Bacteroidia bacterium]MCO5254682.1 aspartate aminotransferase family protein [Bacteroidota bacterium]MCZ2130402.1 aspartate aminotransferase family protein [Bacteroidia bacterium]
MISHKTLFLNLLAQTTPAPLLLEIERAKGVYLYDKEGKTYIDLISGISVSSLGHGNPSVLKAIEEQSKKYLHLMVYGEIVQSPQVMLAQKLSEYLQFKEDTSIYYTNSGSEAIEGAMKLAKRATGRPEFIALKNAYHGSTHGSISLSADSYYTDFYRPLLPQTRRIRQNNFDDLQYITNTTAGVFVETIMGEAGYIPAQIEWMQALRKKCDETGALLILDEVQCGMGRSGTLFAFEPYQIIPDILVLAKAFGAGMPLGAFIANKKIMSVLSNNPILGHISTFGGHPVSCAAALAGLDEITKNKLWENAIKIESLFKKHLTHHALMKISGKGAMLSIELPNQEKCFEFVGKCIENGVLIDWFLYAPNKVRLSPPLILDEKETIKATDIMNSVANTIL